MTQPAPETIEREKDKLYVTDAEMSRWLGVPWPRLKPIILASGWRAIADE